MSLRQACRTLSLSRTVFLYQPDARRDESVIMAAERYPRYRFKKLFRYFAGGAISGITSSAPDLLPAETEFLA